MAVFTMRTYFGKSLEDFLAFHHAERERNPRLYHKRFTMPTETAEGVAVEAVVNDGRLIVHCPFCPTGAEIVDYQDPRFFCLTCRNGEVQGRFVRIILPEGLDV